MLKRPCEAYIDRKQTAEPVFVSYNWSIQEVKRADIILQ